MCSVGVWRLIRWLSQQRSPRRNSVDCDESTNISTPARSHRFRFMCDTLVRLHSAREKIKFFRLSYHQDISSIMDVDNGNFRVQTRETRCIGWRWGLNVVLEGQSNTNRTW